MIENHYLYQTYKAIWLCVVRGMPPNPQSFANLFISCMHFGQVPPLHGCGRSEPECHARRTAWCFATSHPLADGAECAWAREEAWAGEACAEGGRADARCAGGIAAAACLAIASASSLLATVRRRTRSTRSSFQVGTASGRPSRWLEPASRLERIVCRNLLAGLALT